MPCYGGHYQENESKKLKMYVIEQMRSRSVSLLVKGNLARADIPNRLLGSLLMSVLQGCV